jgi:hypothetical protein
MTSKLTLLLPLAAILSLASASASRAALIFNNYTLESILTTTNAGLTLGREFTVGSSAIQLTRLGVYDGLGDGLSSSHQVGVWRTSDQSPVGTATVPAGTDAVLISDWRFVDVIPITLDANTTYRIAALESSPADGNPFGGIISLGSGIASATNGSVYLNGFGYPSLGNSSLRVFANAEFSVVPEPGTAALGALAGLTLLRRRRR